jgi:aryl carrier-like protein
MLPDRLLTLWRLPLTPNGKVNRSAVAELAAQSVEEVAGTAQLPQGELETTLAAIWRELLGLSSVDRNQSFFALGGDSLLATRLVEMLGRRLGLTLSLRQLFQAPSLAALALVAEQTGRLAEETEGGTL